MILSFNPMVHARPHLAILITLCAGIAQAPRADTEAEILFNHAQTHYAAARYGQALDLIQQAVALEPQNSNYQHLLGKCYGRLAEKANPFAAYTLARKTRKALEKAVELDENNFDALKDLMHYYRRAPVFLGGSREKADAIEKKLSETGGSTG
jgi:tetratricopeptide (TPR) repeat protein